MDEPRKPPIVLANRVIRQLVDHTVSEEIVILPADYTAMRVTYRKLGGSWERLAKGDIKHCRLLAQIVKAWGQQPGRIRKTEVG